MKPLVIYHANCADGFGAAFAAWLKFGEEAEYMPMLYLNQKDKTDEDTWNEFGAKVMYWVGREIYILDFSFPKYVTDKLFEQVKKIVWLDHHKTAFEMWTGLYVKCGIHIEHDYDTSSERPWITLDANKSGAMLAWEYFHPDKEVPMLIKRIDDYDRWQFKIEGTKEFNKALWS